jgi:hypothetical protein
MPKMIPIFFKTAPMGAATPGAAWSARIYIWEFLEKRDGAQKQQTFNIVEESGQSE